MGENIFARDTKNARRLGTVVILAFLRQSKRIFLRTIVCTAYAKTDVGQGLAPAENLFNNIVQSKRIFLRTIGCTLHMQKQT